MKRNDGPAASALSQEELARVVNIATGAPIMPPQPQPRPLGNAVAYAALGVIAGILGAATFWTLLDARANRPAITSAGASLLAGQTAIGVPPYAMGPSADYPALLPFPSGAALLPPLPGELSAPPQQAVLPGDAPVFAAPESGAEPAAALVTPAPAPLPGRKQAPTLIFDSGEAAEDSAQVIASPQPLAMAEIPEPPAAAKGLIKPGRLALTRGTVIPAVLESAIDTAQPGGVRAMVSVDVRSADGRTLLIPRSTRLYGQYRTGGSGASASAEVSWTRLQRPDGSTQSLGGAVVSQLAAASGEDATRVRVRPGEPIRVMAARSVEVTAAGK